MTSRFRFWLWQALCLVVLAGCGGGKSHGPEPVSLDSVAPERGSALGGGLIQLSGQGFAPGVQVKLDGEGCEALTVLSSTSLTCVTPAHAQGAVDIQAITPDGRQATITGAYTYRPSDNGISSFGIVAASPAQDVYPNPFSATLESVLAGFDLATVTRSWVVDGTAYKEGDSVSFGAGNHTVNLTVRDATGDSDQASFSIVVGPLTPLSVQRIQSAQSVASNTFALSPGNSISLVNTGFLPVLNPRLIGAGKPDYVDWARYLSSLTQLAGLPADASESSRAKLLEAAWKDLSNTTVHVCSPGREAENIYDPVLLVRGYGYECCSNSSRALAYLGSFLDIPARVRSTLQHEFPEFTVGGSLFILDPDLRFRFWGDNQLPLSAWTTESAPVSLMNVEHYFAQTPTGKYYETQPGGTLPLREVFLYPEQTVRSYYFSNIVAETIWGYHEAFTNSDYVLYPNEKMAFRQTSRYAPLQWLNSDGTSTGGSSAPAVGKVVFRLQWSAGGPRAFQQDGSGNRVIPLNNLPYPVQDLVFYFSKPVNPKAFWLTSGGKTYQMGDFTSNTWTVSAQQLRALDSLSDLAAVVSRDQNVVAVDIGMQFNPGIFGNPAGAVSLSYADDSGDCQRRLSFATGGNMKDVVLGASLCDTRAPQRVGASFDLSKSQPGASVISNYGNSYQGTWGLATPAGVKGYAEISLPRTPGLSGALRVTNEGYFADWQIYEGGSWMPLSTTDVATSQWIQLPAACSPTTLLRLTLRTAPAVDVTYLSYLSLVEARDTGGLPLFGASTSQYWSGGRKSAALRPATAMHR